MYQKYKLIFISLLSVLFFGCANLQSLNMSTDFHGKTSKAIHLDAKQRLLISTMSTDGLQTYCSEPSPDAMAVFASSLGLSVSNPAKAEGDLANTISSAAGTIGLRTQSITLMRDQLFRLCEAYANGKIDKIQVASLYQRSQDLTAVILAIEQLTGVVAAPPVILNGNTNSNTASGLLSQYQILQTAIDDEKNTRDAYEAAQQKVKTAKAAFDEAEAAYLKDKTDPNKTAMEQSQQKLTAAKSNETTSKEKYEAAVKFKKQAQESDASAFINASASTAGQVGTISSTLSSTSVDTISGAVSGMVTAALKKDYTDTTCMSILIENAKVKIEAAKYPLLKSSQIGVSDDTITLCNAILSSSLKKALAEKAKN